MGGEAQQTARNAASQYPKLAEKPVGQRIHNIYRDRLRQFTSGGQYESRNLRSMMYEGRASGKDHVKLSVYSVPDLARPPFNEATSHPFKPTSVGESFGPSWSTHWFQISVTVPSDLQDKKHLEFHWDANNEGLVWSEDGEPLQGLTGGGERIEWILPSGWRDGKEHLFYIEMACNGMFGNALGGDNIQPPGPDRYFKLTTADIVAVNLDARALFVDFWIIGDAAREFPDDSWEEHKALQVANDIMDHFVHGDPESIIKCRKIAQEYLGEKVDSAKVYENGDPAIVFAVGHCHIDSCWLWPWDETKRKVARSWANQCDLLDRYPEHRFVCSQAQQYRWLEQHYPSLYDRVKAKVKAGTFQPIGGSWVEHDTNLPSGESLVRQFLYGQRYFESHFGERSTTFWLPDTFGYSSQIPQLCRLAGMSRFFTQKLSWNNINKFPHTTFNWVALDGTQVLTHMAPAETYTAEAHFGDVKRSVSQHKSMDQDNTSLLVFGKGDGGGGPTFMQIEKLRRCRGLSDKIGLLPRVKMGDSVDDFFARLEKKAELGTKYVTWYGELYFELHRGTYTTQANNKRNNRQSEILMHDLEYLATMATVKGSLDGKDSSFRYPKTDFDEMWEKILLCQFHDCLPGSSIEMCYDDSDEMYAEVFENGQRLLNASLESLGIREYKGLRDENSSDKDGHYPVAFNSLPWSRAEIAKLPSTAESSGSSQYGLLRSEPGLGEVEVLSDTSPTSVASVTEIHKGVFEMSNSEYKALIENGVITSLVDLSLNRELIPKGTKAHQFVLFDDKPLYWQAWDVEVYHLESRQELSSAGASSMSKDGESQGTEGQLSATASATQITERGPHRVSVVVETKISEASWIKTTISLAASIKGHPSYVEFESEVEWHETMKFLKVEFPVDIRNTEASYETQYGIMRRPTHYNTSWDMAKFEVCCHKWVDLSENGYGVSILNDSKYGFATSGNLMRLSLLRAPKAPDAHADMGRHHIRYAIFPHIGGLDSRTIRAAFNFNNPMKVYSMPTSSSTPTSDLLSSIKLTGDPSLVLDAIKRGEDDEDVSRGELSQRKGKSIILRIYDSLGGKSRGIIVTGLLPVKKVWKCNLLEDDEEELALSKDGEVQVELRAFEVATYRLQL
ncbi:MAG: Glycoside hydrolase, 38 vacuolar alpha mannosidase [Peltula sp. TS41687]|nr:MAG: Glycoside hydrolase, 38 vacuolar alpha mannosidase [Peltula sp. TS41687]